MASFYDTFHRADNASNLGTSDSGVAWTTASGTFGILGNQAYPPTGSLSYATVPFGSPNVAVRTTLIVNPSNTSILVRFTNVNNHFYLRNNNGTSYAFSKVAAGVFTQLISGTANPNDGDTITIVCDGNTFTGYVNGVRDWTVTDAFNNAETRFGLRCSIATTRYSQMAAQAIPTHSATWFVATNGTFGGDGTSTLPWDFRTAMTYTPGIVLPGDLIYVRGGNYQTSGDPQNYVMIGDGSTNYVDVRRFPGDPWPRIYTGVWCQATAGSPGGVRFWGLQIVQDNVNRTNNYRGDNPSYGWGGMLLESPNTEFHYCIVANNAGIAGGWFYGEDALGAKVHMCLTYYNGFRDVFNGLPAGQGFYRQADDNGTGLYQYIDTCITGFNYQSGMQIYGSGLSHLNHARTDKSLWFFGGYLGCTYSGGQAIRELLLGSTSDLVSANQVYTDNCWFWPQPTDGTGQHDQAVQLGFNGEDNQFTSFTNNVTKGYVKTQYFRTLEMTGNVTARPLFNGFADQFLSSPLIGAFPTPAGGGIDHNTWYQSNDGVNGVGHGAFNTDDGTTLHDYLTVPLFTAATGYEQHSTLSGFPPATIATVMPNTVEPNALWPTPRAFIYVFNFQNQAATTIDPSACLGLGDTYAIYDWGAYELDSPTPILTGTYTGGTITLPLGTQYTPTLIADPVGARSQHATLPTFTVSAGGVPGAYILAKTGQTSDQGGTTGFSPPAAPIHGHFPIRKRWTTKFDYRNKA